MSEISTPLPLFAGLGREERTKVDERSEAGEGGARGTTLTRVADATRPLPRRAGEVNRRRRVAVLYGGISAEREVSLSSGVQVIAALRGAGFDITPIEVGHDLAAVITALTPRPDAVFNALHGRFGEDGAI